MTKRKDVLVCIFINILENKKFSFENINKSINVCKKTFSNALNDFRFSLLNLYRYDLSLVYDRKEKVYNLIYSVDNNKQEFDSCHPHQKINKYPCFLLFR